MTAAMPGNKARAQAFWTELFNAHDLRNVRAFFAPGFVNHNARPGTPDGPGGAEQVFGRLMGRMLTTCTSTCRRWWQKVARSSASA